MKTKAKIMIVDDAEMNREILMVILGDEYEYVQAENGRQAIHILQQDMNIDLMLLDINMPEMNGFQVLDRMNTFHWINDIPVIMISSEEKKDAIERAYILGAEDYIRRPFDAFIVRRRVQNILNLYANQKRLMQMVADQIYEKEENNNLMIGILSHVVEFRNSESGEHILHIRTATELLLRRLVQKTDEYHLSESDIVMITTASALHDIGKISIPESILNKPGKLTREEFSIIKTHTTIGADIINQMTTKMEKPLLRIAGEIAAAQSQAAAIALHVHENAESGHGAGMNDAVSLNEGRVTECAPSGMSMDVPVASGAENGNKLAYMTQLAAIDQRIAELKAARVIALDIIPGAVPMETYCFPKRCLMLFGAEGPGLSEKALELADDVVYISQFGSVRSINAGAAAAVSMHAWIAQHAAPQS